MSSAADVRADDQLLLVTCVNDADERRMVCARRLRDGESKEALTGQVRLMEKK